MARDKRGNDRKTEREDIEDGMDLVGVSSEVEQLYASRQDDASAPFGWDSVGTDCGD